MSSSLVPSLPTPHPMTSLQDLPSVHGTAQSTCNILFINPNASPSMTISCLEMIAETIPADVAVYGYTGPKEKAPITIEGHLDSVLSSAEVFRDAYVIIGQADAVVVGCFSDHPLVNCIREEFAIPCCGIMEAAFYGARMLGGRFGVLCTSYRSQIRHQFAVRAFGMEPFCAGLLSTKLSVKELETKRREEVLELIIAAATDLIIEKDADCLVLGCAGMSELAQGVRGCAAQHGVPVIDGVCAAVNILSGWVRMGLKTSKRGLFTDTKVGRQLRGQTYL